MKNAINRALNRTTGYELRKVRGSANGRVAVGRGDRLLRRPGFVLSSVRSGSTLLRVIVDSHSMLHAPHEMHLRDVAVQSRSRYLDRALAAVGLDQRGLEYLLWDRYLQRELARSGKQRLVNKTPNDVFVVDRIRECWPDAQLVFLLRHPAAIARSRAATRPQDTEERNLQMVRRYCDAVQDARTRYDGLTVRYEELTAEPERVTQELCAFLGVPWERGMLDYGRHDHGKLKPGLGDWKDKIKSGAIHPAPPPPPEDEVPEPLRPLCRTWGYL